MAGLGLRYWGSAGPVNNVCLEQGRWGWSMLPKCFLPQTSISNEQRAPAEATETSSMPGSGFRGLCNVRGKAIVLATFVTSPPKREYPNSAESSLFPCIFQVSIPENIKTHPSWNPRNKHSQDPTQDLFSPLFKCSRFDFIPTENVFVALSWKLWPENGHRHLSWTSWHFIRIYVKPETGREGSRGKERKERQGEGERGLEWWEYRVWVLSTQVNLSLKAHP